MAGAIVSSSAGLDADVDGWVGRSIADGASDERHPRPLTIGSHENDDVLMAAIADGDEQAFASLVERHADSIHGYVLRMTGSRADAEDFTQETFLKVWRKARTYRPGRVAVGTWLHRVAHNLTVDALRRPREVSVAALPDDAADAGGVFEVHAAREAVTRLNAVLERLPAAQRAALLLGQVHGFSNAEVAAIVGVSVRAVESLLARARRTLRRELGDEGDSP